MGKTDSHVQKWRHNRSFLGLIPDKYCDWMATVAFYAAVHAVEALFVFDGNSNHTSHSARNDTLKRVNRYKAIWRHFRPLYDASSVSRYQVDASEWLNPTKVKSELVEQSLYGVEASVSKLMELDEQLPRIDWSSNRDS